MTIRSLVAAAGLVFCGIPAAADTFDCVLDPSVSVKLGSSVPGILDAVLVDRGDVVEAGQIVARLSSVVELETERLIEMQAENDSAIHAQQARVDFLMKRLERTRTLTDRGVATVDLLQELEAEVEVSLSQLRQAETDQAIARQDLARTRAALALRDIRSPIDGLVVARHLAPGEYLQTEDQILTIVALDPLYVETFLPVTFSGLVRVGDTAKVRPAAPYTSVHDATVTVVDQLFEAASGTFGVRLELENPGFALPAGHRCVVDLGGS